MNSKTLLTIVILGAVLLFAGCGCSSYNGLVQQDETVKKAWNDLQSQYQRRADLIPNLVATVKGVADFEKNTYIAVAEARAGRLKQLTNIPAEQLTPERMAEIQQASTEATQAARMAINVAIEAYPQLKANQNFSELQAQLEGTENRITTARNDYNSAIQDYNTRVRSFPLNVLAGIFGFKVKEGFKADPGSERAPTVDFSK